MPNVAMELDSLEATKRMVEQGLGIALVPLVCLQRELAQGDLVGDLSDAPADQPPISLVYRQPQAVTHRAGLPGGDGVHLPGARASVGRRAKGSKGQGAVLAVTLSEAKGLGQGCCAPSPRFFVRRWRTQNDRTRRRRHRPVSLVPCHVSRRPTSAAIALRRSTFSLSGPSGFLSPRGSPAPPAGRARRGRPRWRHDAPEALEADVALADVLVAVDGRRPARPSSRWRAPRPAARSRPPARTRSSPSPGLRPSQVVAGGEGVLRVQADLDPRCCPPPMIRPRSANFEPMVPPMPALFSRISRARPAWCPARLQRGDNLARRRRRSPPLVAAEVEDDALACR